MKMKPPISVQLKSLTLKRFIMCPITVSIFMLDSNLEKLNISLNPRLRERLSILLAHDFPALNTLIVNDCSLTSDDLKSLAKARSQGKLPKLRHLDLSQNKELTNQIEAFFCYDQTWSAPETLNITQQPVSDKDFQKILKKVKLGCLGSLTELRVSLKCTRDLKTYYVEMPRFATFLCRLSTWPTLCGNGSFKRQ